MLRTIIQEYIQQHSLSFHVLLHQAYTPTMRHQQDFSKSSCSCYCPPHLSCSFLSSSFPLSIYFSGCLPLLLVPSTCRIALLPEVFCSPSLLRARTTSTFFS